MKRTGSDRSSATNIEEPFWQRDSITDTPLWFEYLEQAIQNNQERPETRFFQLATLTPQGHPANRTVVFRGFLDATGTLMMVSDQRSPKITHIHHHPWGEACWYFTISREQFRIAGPLHVVDHTCAVPHLRHQRHQLWQQLSEAARRQFTGPAPGMARPQTEPQHRSSRSQLTPSVTAPMNATQPLPHFCVLLLEPHQVDHLRLQGEPHPRYLYQRQMDGSWLYQLITP